MIPDIPISSGVYKITYSNGVVQYKHLISRQDYEIHIKPLKDEMLEIMKQPSSNNQKKKLDKLSSKLKSMEGGYRFLEGSPLFNAIKTGKLVLPEQMGGTHNIKIELVR